MNTKQLQVAMQINRLLQLSVQGMALNDEAAMEVADLYPEWVAKKTYKKDDIIKWGVNTDGETQLYKVASEHVSQDQYPPDTDITHYTKIGFTEGGIPIWTQPLGSHDAYNAGDVVSHNGELWVSDVDGNVWEPGVYGWTKKTQTATVAAKTAAKATTKK